MCLAVCPLKRFYPVADLSILHADQSCIHCGACRTECPANALTYRDDTQAFFQALAAGTPIAVLAAPAVKQHFSDYRRLFGFLRSLGVDSFHNVLLRADITLWAYKTLFKLFPGKPFISSPCAAVSMYIMRNSPVLQSHVMPVHSPLMCAAIFLKKYRHVPHRFAFLSPCVGKRAEFQLPGIAQGSVCYNVTFGNLKQYLLAHGIDLSQFEPIDFADSAEGNGQTFARYGSITGWLEQTMPEKSCMRISGVENVYPYLAGYEQALQYKQVPDFLEVYNCVGGCEEGTGVGRLAKRKFSPSPCDHSNLADSKALFKQFDRELNLADFIR